MSSGGHIGLRIGDEVFHYQHDPAGFISLARDPWTRFRLIYNDLDNRNIYIARFKVEDADLARIRDRFVRLHLIQQRHLDFLAALQHDAELLLSPGSPEVKGAGLFQISGSPHAGLTELRAAISARFGDAYLTNSADELERRASQAAYSAPAVDFLTASPDQFPAYPATYSERLLDSLAKRMALRVLTGNAAPAVDAWLAADRFEIPDADVRLTPAERERLAAIAEALRTSILTLLASPRGDAGFPLLLATSRYLAIRQSLATGRLVLVNPYCGRVARIPYPFDVEAKSGLRRHALLFAAEFRATRRAFFELAEPDEASLNLLENSAARYFETHLARLHRRPYRLAAEFVVPEAPGAVPAAPKPPSNPPSSIAAATETHRRFLERLRAIYPYSVVSRNCATELVRALNSSFRDETDARRALGAVIEPDSVSSRMPFRLYAEASSSYRGVSTEVLPSYRNRMLARWSSAENPILIHLAESNTATSSLYRSRPGDTAFLFFTDDVLWLRPAYGAANLSYGLLQAGAGMITAPLDRGARITEGLRGALFSLPELAFFNIRKGSFAGYSLR
jgi:hypothetical protein